MSFDHSWETEIYSKGLHVNRYPFGELVPFVMRPYAARLRAGERLKVLELGFGTGNNLQFFCKEGFETYGIEGSKSACEIASRFLQKEGFSADITCGDFSDLPYPEGFFDLIVDRESVYANRKQAIQKISREVLRCLKPGGRFLTFTYSTDHGDIVNGGGQLVEPNTFIDFKSGSFSGAGTTHFFSENEIRNEYLDGFQIEYIYHHRSDMVFPEARNQYSEYITSARKPE